MMEPGSVVIFLAEANILPPAVSPWMFFWIAATTPVLRISPSPPVNVTDPSVLGTTPVARITPVFLMAKER